MKLSKDELQKYAKSWINCNMHDGEDRSMAKGDRHMMTAPELYELVDELIDDAFWDFENGRVNSDG